MKNFLKGVFLSFLIVIVAHADYYITKDQLDDYTSKGYILSDNYESITDCNNALETKQEFKNYERSICFSSVNGYNYFMCNASLNCDISSTTKNILYKDKLDEFISKLETYKEKENYEETLNNIKASLSTLKNKYSNNYKINSMITYLEEGVSNLIEEYNDSNDFTDFFSDLSTTTNSGFSSTSTTTSSGFSSTGTTTMTSGTGANSNTSNIGTTFQSPFYSINGLRYALWATDKTAWGYCNYKGYPYYLSYEKNCSTSTSPYKNNPGSANYSGNIGTYNKSSWGVWANGSCINKIVCGNSKPDSSVGNNQTVTNSCEFYYTYTEYKSYDCSSGIGKTNNRQDNNLSNYSQIKYGSEVNGSRCSYIHSSASRLYKMISDNGNCILTDDQISKAKMLVEKNLSQIQDQKESDEAVIELKKKQEEEAKAKAEEAANTLSFGYSKVTTYVDKYKFYWKAGSNYKSCYLSTILYKKNASGTYEKLGTSFGESFNPSSNYIFTLSKTGSKKSDFILKCYKINPSGEFVSKTISIEY
ncbi:MAG: hypothetical protein PHN31_01120 [Candidatus Gracilibacteria bacterium]|nr:hypothetical protein [Candidatus Gracilibacteria bacterium]